MIFGEEWVHHRDTEDTEISILSVSVPFNCERGCWGKGEGVEYGRGDLLKKSPAKAR